MNRLAPIVLGIACAAAVAAAAPPQVEITSPHAGTPAFGAVSFTVVVKADEAIVRVRFVVDGRPVGELDHPPYQIITLLGEENAEHHFRAEATTSSGVSGAADLNTPVFRSNAEVEIELRQLYVRVTRGTTTKAEGKTTEVEAPVASLKAPDFIVTDNGTGQAIKTFASGEAPLAAVVLLDASASMTGERMKAALGGASAFFRAMAPLDEGRLIVFSDRLLHVSPFTTVSDVLLAGLGSVRPQGGTALNDNLYLALRQVDQRQGRRVVILLSDGVDSDSVLAMSDVRRVARASQAIIYWIRLDDIAGTNEELPSLYSTWRDKKSHQHEFRELIDTIRENGGRIVSVNALDRIGPAFADVLRELREQYVLGYYPTERRHDGSWHKIAVAVRNTALRVRTREGYLDF